MSVPWSELFPGATQNETSITIPKAFMTQYGLVPSVNNLSESLLFALLFRASEIMTEQRRLLNRTTQYGSVTLAGKDAIEDIPGSDIYVTRFVLSGIWYQPITLPDVDL